MESQFGDKRFFVPCLCYGEILGLVHNREDKDWYISSYVDEFGSLQDNAWTIFKRRVSLAWKILRGKEYSFYDIVVSDDNMKELVAQLTEEIK